MEFITGIFLFFGLGLLGLAVLVLSLLFARRRSAAISGGIAGGILMALQCLLLLLAAGIGSATSGQQAGYRVFGWVIFGCALSVAIYFFIILAKFNDRD